MKIEKLSASSISTFNRCPHKFILSYQLGLRGVTGVAAAKGTCTHKVFELLALGQLGQTVEDDIVGLVTPADLTEDEIINLVITKYPEKYPEVELVKKDFDEIVKVSKKGLAFEDGRFNPRGMQNIISPEKRFSIEIDEPWGAFRVSGFIDLVVKNSDNSITIFDYKTASRLKDFDTDKDITLEYQYKNVQSRLYHWAASKIFPEYDYIDVVFYFIKHDTTFPLYIDKADAYKVEAFLKRKYAEMMAIKTTKLEKNWKCRFCDFSQPISGIKGDKESETICEFYRKQIVINGLENVVNSYKSNLIK